MILLKVETELEPILQCLIGPWNCLVLIQEEVVMATTAETTLICLDPTSWIVLIQEVGSWKGCTFIGERIASNGTFNPSLA